ncbi:hypothetical protein HDU93_009812 [Gonapodya sp. JEL0774]|nr:hypothetical protein HDU93_009812 [Gonapodya sp. JEL0774]
MADRNDAPIDSSGKRKFEDDEPGSHISASRQVLHTQKRTLAACGPDSNKSDEDIPPTPPRSNRTKPKNARVSFADQSNNFGQRKRETSSLIQFQPLQIPANPPASTSHQSTTKNTTFVSINDNCPSLVGGVSLSQEYADSEKEAEKRRKNVEELDEQQWHVMAQRTERSGQSTAVGSLKSAVIRATERNGVISGAAAREKEVEILQQEVARLNNENEKLRQKNEILLAKVGEEVAGTRQELEAKLEHLVRLRVLQETLKTTII